MSRILTILFAAILIITLAACADNANGSATLTPSADTKALLPSEYSDADFDTSGDVIVTTEYELYASDVEEVSYTIKNNTAEEYTYGVQYAVEVYRDGQWYQVPFPENTAWIEIGIILKANETNSDSFKLSALDYKMTDGKYRLIKDVGGKHYFAVFQVGK